MPAEDAYAIIDRIIVNGFLTAEMRVDGSYIVMKNMSDRESLMLDMFRDAENVLDDIACRLSFCTFSVDGMNFLPSRAEAMPALMGFWREAPTSLVVATNMAVQGISERYLEVISYLEGYCYTDKSRYLWRVYKEGGLFAVPGAVALGLNAVQENWAVVNRSLDDEDDYNKDFNLSLMVASSFNSKGAKVISRNYDTKRTELLELRAEIAKWGYDRKRVEEEKKQSEWTVPLRSREDLVRELYRQMRGEKDKHDLFMEKWMQKQRERAEQVKQRAIERAKQWREKAQAAPIDMEGEDSRQATSEEVEKLSGARASYVSKYMSAYEGLDKDERFLRKIGARVIGE